MTDNEKFPGGGREGLNLTHVSGTIHAEAEFSRATSERLQ